MKRKAVSRFCRRPSMRRMICAATVTSSGWVMLSAMTSAGSEISASTIMTRCIMPPENWNGASWNRAPGEGMRTAAEEVEHLFPCLRPAGPGPHGAQLFDDLLADRQARIERAHRIGADKADGGCRGMAERPRGGRARISLPSKTTVPAVISSGGDTARTSARASTDLPEPASPTRPSTSPGSSEKLTSSTMRRLRPRAGDRR